MRGLLVFLICLPAAVEGGEWHVDRKAGGNQVEYTSSVAAFTFTGETGQIDGFIYWEGDSLSVENSQLHFEVNLASFDSGIGKRDRDMREVLDTDKWPKAVYKGEITGLAAVDTSVTAFRVETRGTLSLRGVDRAIGVPGLVVVEGERSKVEAAFSIELADYGIEAPSLAAFVKVSQKIDLEVSVSLAEPEVNE